MTPATYEPTPIARLDALQTIAPDGAGTTWFHFRCFDAVHDSVNRVLYVAQDDWLPEPFSGEPDPIQDEWKEVLAVAERYGLPATAVIDEPAFDRETGVWVWVVEF